MGLPGPAHSVPTGNPWEELGPQSPQTQNKGLSLQRRPSSLSPKFLGPVPRSCLFGPGRGPTVPLAGTPGGGGVSQHWPLGSSPGRGLPISHATLPPGGQLSTLLTGKNISEPKTRDKVIFFNHLAKCKHLP